jgi:hypothetical protein
MQQSAKYSDITGVSTSGEHVLTHGFGFIAGQQSSIAQILLVERSVALAEASFGSGEIARQRSNQCALA